MKKIFYHLPDATKKDAVLRICKEQQIETCALAQKDINCTVAALCNLPVKASGSKKTAPPLYTMPEMLLFFGLGDADLDRFLDAYHATGLTMIKRKAVVTPTNLGWTVYELLDALEKEIDK